MNIKNLIIYGLPLLAFSSLGFTDSVVVVPVRFSVKNINLKKPLKVTFTVKKNAGNFEIYNGGSKTYIAPPCGQVGPASSFYLVGSGKSLNGEISVEYKASTAGSSNVIFDKKYNLAINKSYRTQPTITYINDFVKTGLYLNPKNRKGINKYKLSVEKVELSS